MKKRPNVQPIQHTLFSLDKPNEAAIPSPQEIVRPFEIPGTQILLGTSSFAASGWEGSFYPKGMKSTNYLSYYAKQFRTVEIDSTFYGTPSASSFGICGTSRKLPAWCRVAHARPLAADRHLLASSFPSNLK